MIEKTECRWRKWCWAFRLRYNHLYYLFIFMNIVARYFASRCVSIFYKIIVGKGYLNQICASFFVYSTSDWFFSSLCYVHSFARILNKKYVYSMWTKRVETSRKNYWFKHWINYFYSIWRYWFVGLFHLGTQYQATRTSNSIIQMSRIIQCVFT